MPVGHGFLGRCAVGSAAAVFFQTKVIDDIDEKGARFLASTPLERKSVASMKSSLVTGDVENAALPGGSLLGKSLHARTIMRATERDKVNIIDNFFRGRFRRRTWVAAI